MRNKKRMHYRLVITLVVSVLCGFVGVGRAAKPAGSLYPSLPTPELRQKQAPDDNVVQAEDKFKRLFAQGYEQYSRGHYQQAIHHLYPFLCERTPDETDYEWAEFFFGISLKRLGYSHAAVDTLANLVARKPNPKIVSYSLELLEEISRSVPFDRDLLINRSLCDQNYGFVEGEVSDFVHYYQGEYDWEHGLYEWGDEHFEKLRPDSYYYNKYLFKKALRELYGERLSEAIRILKQILLKLPDGDPLKDDARKTLARLYYETGKFAGADLLYQQVEMNIVEQAQNLLERAWTHYRMGNPERAMGLLYSFEAPSYTHSFTPEFYILKSFIYKDVCHYEKAMQILGQFKKRYGSALETIYKRRPPQDNQAMMLVLLNKTKIKQLWRFLDLLDREQAKCAENPDPAIKAYLNRLYTLKKEEAEQRFRILVNDEFEKMADAMLRFEEEANLMEYEIGIDMYQRVYDYHYSEDKSEKNKNKKLGGKAVYNFQGEFWNDELDDYKVVLPNKCQNAEEWDIFFK